MGKPTCTHSGPGAVDVRFDRLVILVVEDHDDSREMLRQMLESLGAHVLLAEDGRAGVRMLKQARPDVILADLVMPGMDGLAFARHVRRDHRFGGVPIIATTALGSEADRLHTWAYDFDAHLTKPIRPDVLATAVHQALEQRSARASSG